MAKFIAGAGSTALLPIQMGYNDAYPVNLGVYDTTPSNLTLTGFTETLTNGFTANWTGESLVSPDIDGYPTGGRVTACTLKDASSNTVFTLSNFDLPLIDMSTLVDSIPGIENWVAVWTYVFSGNDSIVGGAGNDTLQGLYGNDTMNGAGGNDSILGWLGNDSLVGSNGNDSLIGGRGNDTLNGGAGTDMINGGGSSDTLTGGTGNDYFFFNTGVLSGTNIDTVTDFSKISGNTDKLKLDNDYFVGIQGVSGVNTALKSGQFYAAAAGDTGGKDTGDRIGYDSVTGAMYYDADGNAAGAAVQFAILGTSTHPTLAYTDIIVID